MVKGSVPLLISKRFLKALMGAVMDLHQGELTLTTAQVAIPLIEQRDGSYQKRPAKVRDQEVEVLQAQMDEVDEGEEESPFELDPNWSPMTEAAGETAEDEGAINNQEIHEDTIEDTEKGLSVLYQWDQIPCGWMSCCSMRAMKLSLPSLGILS